MLKLPVALALALTANLAVAQLLVVGANQVGTSSAATTATWAANGSRRFQNIYDSSLFTNAGCTGPITITRLRWRQADNVVSPGGNVWTNVTVQMSSALTNFAAPATTFAANRGANNLIVFNGTVTSLPAIGATPNSYVIDLQLTSPFVFNPVLGADLLIEVDHAFASPTIGFGSMAASSLSSLHLARRVGATSQGSGTGTASDQASVVLFDFTGPGGTGNLSIASTQPYGDGCYRLTSSFYETFANSSLFDLRGAPTTTTNISMLPTGPYGYLVSISNGSITPPASTPLLSNAVTPVTIGDDDFSQPQTLPFTLNHPGGSCTTIHIAANGFIQLGGTPPTPGTASDFTPSVGEFLSQTARLCPLWNDWHCSRNVNTNPAAGVYFDIDPSNTRVYITWLAIGEFAQATSGVSVSTFQVMIDVSGSIEYRYESIGAATAAVNLCGFARGIINGAQASDPGNRDISATAPFAASGPDGNPLTLSAATRPLSGTTMTFTTSNIPTLPTPVVLGGTILSFLQVNPGFDLAILGAPGCREYANASGGTTVIFLTNGATSANMSLPIPNGSSYLGLRLFTQSFVLQSSANPLGLLTSNGITAQIGAF